MYKYTISLLSPCIKTDWQVDIAKICVPYDTELAVIYDTEDKERQIAEQKAKILQQRLWGIAAVFTLFILFFLVYDWYRRRSMAQ